MKIEITFDDGSKHQIDTDNFVIVSFEPTGEMDGEDEVLSPKTYLYPPNQTWVPMEGVMALGSLIASMGDTKMEIVGRAIMKTVDTSLKMVMGKNQKPETPEG